MELEWHKIVYYQIDLSSEERLFPESEYKASCEKTKLMVQHREEAWVKIIKEKIGKTTNSLLLVGEGHLQNLLDYSHCPKFSLDTPFLKKLDNETIRYQIIEFTPDPHT